MANKGKTFDQLIEVSPSVLKGFEAKKQLEPLLLNRWTPFIRVFLLNPPNITSIRDQKKNTYGGVEWEYDLQELIEGVTIKEDGPAPSKGNVLLPLADSFTQMGPKHGVKHGARRGGIGVKQFTYTYNAQDMVIADAELQVEFNHASDLESFKGKSLFNIGQDLLIQFGWSVPEGAMPIDRKKIDWTDLYESVENLVQDLSGKDSAATNAIVDVDLTDRAASTSMWIKIQHYSFDLKFQKDGAMLGIYKLMDGCTLSFQQLSGVTSDMFEKAMKDLPGIPPPEVKEVEEGDTIIEVPIGPDLSTLPLLTPDMVAVESERAKWEKEDGTPKPRFQIGPNNSPWNDIEALQGLVELGASLEDGDSLKGYIDSMSLTNGYYQLGDVLEATYRAYLAINADALPKGAMRPDGTYWPSSNITYADIQSSAEGYFSVAMPWIKQGVPESTLKAFTTNTPVAWSALFTDKAIINKTSEVKNIYQLPVSKDKVDGYFKAAKGEGSSLEDIYDDIIELLPNTFELQFKPTLDNQRRILYWPAEQVGKIRTQMEKSWEEKAADASAGKGILTLDWGTRHGLVESIDFEMAITPDILYNINLPFISGEDIIAKISQVEFKAIDGQTGNLSAKGIVAQRMQTAVTNYMTKYPGARFIPNDELKSAADVDSVDGINDYIEGLALFLDNRGLPIIDPYVTFRHWYSGVKVVVHGFVGLEGLTPFQIHANIPGIEKCVYATTMVKHIVTPESFMTYLNGYQMEGVDLGKMAGEVDIHVDNSAYLKSVEDDAEGMAKYKESEERIKFVLSSVSDKEKEARKAAEAVRAANVLKGDLSLFQKMQYALIRNPSIGATTEQKQSALADGEPQSAEDEKAVDALMAKIAEINAKLLEVEDWIEEKSKEAAEFATKIALQAALTLLKKGKALLSMTVGKLTGVSLDAIEAFVDWVKKQAAKVKKAKAEAKAVKTQVQKATALVSEISELDQTAKVYFEGLKANALNAASQLGKRPLDPDWDAGTSFYDERRKNYALGEEPKSFRQSTGFGWNDDLLDEDGMIIPGMIETSEVTATNTVLGGPIIHPRTKTRENIEPTLAAKDAQKAEKDAEKIEVAQIMADTGVNKSTAKEFNEAPAEYMILIPNKKKKPGQYDTVEYVPKASIFWGGIDVKERMAAREITLKSVIEKTGVPLWEILEYNQIYTLEFLGLKAEEVDADKLIATTLAPGQTINIPVATNRYIDSTVSKTYEKYMFAMTRPAEPPADAPPIAVWYEYRIKKGDTITKILEKAQSHGYNAAMGSLIVETLINFNKSELKLSREQAVKFKEASQGQIIHNRNRKQRWESDQSSVANQLAAGLGVNNDGTAGYSLIVGEPFWVPFPSGRRIPDDSKMLSAEERQAIQAAKDYLAKINGISATLKNYDTMVAENPARRSSKLMELKMAEQKQGLLDFRDKWGDLLTIAVELGKLDQKDLDLEIDMGKKRWASTPTFGVNDPWPIYQG